MMRLFESECWIWKQMWLYRSQLWNIKLGRAPHMCLELCGKNSQNTTTQLLSKTHSAGDVIFQTSWRYRLIFDQSLTIHLEIFGQWVSGAYKQREAELVWTSKLRRLDDQMMTWSLKFDQWSSVMPGFWDDGTKAISPSAVIIREASNDGLNQEVHQWIRAAIFEGSCPWMKNSYSNISEPPHPPRMRGVVVKAALVLSILAPALVVGEDDLAILDDIWNPGTKIQRGDMAGDTEVSSY